MSLIGPTLLNLSKSPLFNQSYRSISITSVNYIKQLIREKKGDTLILEAKIVPDPKEERLIQRNENGACTLCSAGIDVKHTDVMILSQFVRSDGCMMPRRVTGLCKTQHKRVETMVIMAHRAGLMPNLVNKNPRKDPFKRGMFKRFNTYFDEDTMKWKYFNVTYNH